MLSVLPFNNTVDRVLLTGAALLQVLEWNLAGLCPDQSCDPPEFFQVGGARLDLVVRSRQPAPRLTVRVKLNYLGRDLLVWREAAGKTSN